MANKVEKKKETYVLEETVNIDNKQSVIPLKIDFNTGTGNVSMTLKLTTKQMSFEDPQMEACLKQCEAMLKDGYLACRNLLEEWLRKNRPGGENQLSLLDQIQGQEFDTEDLEIGATVSD